MKKQLVSAVRKTLPKSATKGLENSYRRGRSRLIRARYGNPAKKLKVIAVTGTNGKTTTLSYLNAILKEAGYKTAMFTTAQIEVNGEVKLNELNMTVGSTATMQRFFKRAKKAKVDYVLLEATSHALDQHKLDGVPIMGAIMTNLTQDHLDYHKTMEGYAAAKGLLFANEPDYIVLNRDDDWFGFFDKFAAKSQKITYGKDADADARIDYVKLYSGGSDAVVVIDHQTRLELGTALPGEYNVYNMTAAVSMAYLLGLDIEVIADGVAELDGVPGRFEYIESDKPYDIIVDFAHTPDGLEKLLTAAKSVTKGRVIVVFGADGDRDRDKRPVMGEIACRLADRVVVTSQENHTEDPDQIIAGVMEGIREAKGEARTDEIPDRRDAIKKALDIAKKGDMVVVAGLGPDRYRMMANGQEPWNDGDVIRELLNQ